MSVLAYVHASDSRVSGRLRDWVPPRWFQVWMLAATRWGDGWGWLVLAPALAAGEAPHRRALVGGAVSAALASLVLVAIKRRIRRPRPCAEGLHPVFRVAPPDRFSFPSGHATNAFAIGSVLALQIPAFTPAVAFLATSIAASRVVLGLHYLSDVVAGSVLGAAIGLAVGAAL
jgi:undecaprenyl-diphosphatase